ncbi:uncharacterized protein MELLADRAFT_72904 [Melampsora larici-populina 98AG31]|uniref:Uncharacterized protein n=1 Tax=Melampsora larici-populina (strain 98AG31 / pathotype 3-4-7) TaxID=747676 RepID=F4S0J9_MELLP|nr:uncharacterized protein MELLADRAFT_72904 [Melampsora larici-populina 98AG31]EGG01778.1 hypothetical protein MELLADRAFT_72904 [Melampsora larici-populina 98AG31]
MEQVKGLQQVLEPVKDTVEGLFAQWITGQFNQSLTGLNFSKLRVIATHYMPYPSVPMSDLSWLEVPMFKNVRTIITDLDRGQEYWKHALKLGRVDVLKKVPNLKHMVFTTYVRFLKEGIQPELIEAFKYHGVQCHLFETLTSDEILKLDLELNGPMEISH